MEELIKRGHIYIAQPPLYKVNRAKSEQYLKDERALEDYLIATGLEDAVLRLASGEERAGADSAQAGRRCTRDPQYSQRAAQPLQPQGHRAGGDRRGAQPRVTDDAKKGAAAAAYIAKRLDALEDETERGWKATFDENGFHFERTVRGVKEVADYRSGAARLGRRAQARRVRAFAAADLPAADAAGDAPPQGRNHRDPRAGRSVRGAHGAGRKGLSLQRYKGLGEMNPEQLWETTLDTNARSLLQVRIKEVDEANVLFDQLMGDLVEPRRQFIQDNALAASVDV